MASVPPIGGFYSYEGRVIIEITDVVAGDHEIEASPFPFTAQEPLIPGNRTGSKREKAIVIIAEKRWLEQPNALGFFRSSTWTWLQLLRRERRDDFLEARITAQRIPPRIETKIAIGWAGRYFRDDFELFNRSLVLAGPRENQGKVGHESWA